MTAFTPTSFHAVATLLAALSAVLGLVLAVTRTRSRAAAWGLAAAAALFAERATVQQPPGVRMLALIALVLCAMKAVVGVESAARLSALQWLAFAALWPGMRPAPFTMLPSSPRPGAARLGGRGAACLGLGAALVLLGRFLWCVTGSCCAATAVVLPGLSLVLHFGIFNLLTAAWRAAGVDVEPLFRAPLVATSLREFWGRRWNIAFSEMTASVVYRPVSRAIGRRGGLAASFLASGLLHELAISVPVRAGFGLPLLYFVLQGAAVIAEEALQARGTPRNARAWIGRAWTLAWLAIPLPILFHPPFLRGIVWPLVGLSG